MSGERRSFRVDLLTYSVGGLKHVTIEIRDPVMLVCAPIDLEDLTPGLSVARERAKQDVLHNGGDPNLIEWNERRKPK